MKKFSKIVALVAAMMLLAGIASAAELEMTGTSVTMNDGGIRINVWNPWGKDDCHAVPDINVIEGMTEMKVTVTVTGADQVGGSFNIWISASNFTEGDEEISIWDGPDSGKNCNTNKVAVNGDGDYTVTLTVDTPWVLGENNFIMIGSDIDAAAWGELNDGEGDASLLAITKIDITKDAADDTPADDTPADDTPADDTPADDTPADDTPATGDATNLVILSAVAILALCGVVVSSKKRA